MGKKLTPTPRITKAVVTGRELLTAIKKAVLDEPARADLGWWVTSFRGDARYREEVSTAPEPACGTVACLAGWGAVLLRPTRMSAARLSAAAEDVLTKLIGYDIDDGWFDRPTYSVGELFSEDISEEFGETKESFGDPGTLKHAQTIANRITAYLEKHPEVAKRKISVRKARKLIQAYDANL